MATFAKIGLNNKVIEVLSVHNNELLDSNGVEKENIGIDFLTKLTGWDIWKQTSYNTHGGVHSLEGTPFRKNHASFGSTYDAVRDAFISPQPYPSWTLDEDTCQYEAPVAFPFGEAGSSFFEWDEETTNWIEIT